MLPLLLAAATTLAAAPAVPAMQLLHTADIFRHSHTIQPRIPSVVDAGGGGPAVLVAFAEARRGSCKSGPPTCTCSRGSYAIVTARSTSAGRTWSAPQVVAGSTTDGTGGCINYPGAVHDARTNTTVLQFVHSQHLYGGACRVRQLTSTSQGRTFSHPYRCLDGVVPYAPTGAI